MKSYTITVIFDFEAKDMDEAKTIASKIANYEALDSRRIYRIDPVRPVREVQNNEDDT